MEWKKFFTFPCGRIACITSGFLLAAAGALALLGPGAHAVPFLALATIAGIVGFISSLVLATRFFQGEVMFLLVALPLGAGFYAAAVQYAPRGGIALGAALLAVAALPAWLGLSGFRRLRV